MPGKPPKERVALEKLGLPHPKRPSGRTKGTPIFKIIHGTCTYYFQELGNRMGPVWINQHPVIGEIEARLQEWKIKETDSQRRQKDGLNHGNPFPKPSNLRIFLATWQNTQRKIPRRSTKYNIGPFSPCRLKPPRYNLTLCSCNRGRDGLPDPYMLGKEAN